MCADCQPKPSPLPRIIRAMRNAYSKPLDYDTEKAELVPCNDGTTLVRHLNTGRILGKLTDIGPDKPKQAQPPVISSSIDREYVAAFLWALVVILCAGVLLWLIGTAL